jgi:hypothetical protein
VGKPVSSPSDPAVPRPLTDPEEARAPRPLVERIGLAFIAVVLAALFAGMGVTAWIGNEGFLALMAGTGALMTLWAAGSSLFRR